MNIKTTLTILIFGVFALSAATAQPGRGNGVSIQVGYNFKHLNPNAFNFVIDKYNSQTSLSTRMEPVSWTPGVSAGIGLHRGRANFRLNGMLYQGRTFAIGTDGTGASFRRDAAISGSVISLGLNSQLIQLYRDGSFNVGGSVDLMNVKTFSSQVPATSFSEGDPLDELSDSWRVGFTILAPFRFGITPFFKISLEPYYQIFFSRVSFRSLSLELNGTSVPLDSPELSRELDNFGVNATLMFVLGRQ